MEDATQAGAVISPWAQPNPSFGRIFEEDRIWFSVLNTPMTHQGGLADRRRPTWANHRHTTLGRRPRPSQNRPLCLTIVDIHLWRIWQSGNDLARTWQRLGMPEREGGNLTNVLQALEGVLEALGSVLEGLGGVLEAMLDQYSTKVTTKSKNI